MMKKRTRISIYALLMTLILMITSLHTYALTVTGQIEAATKLTEKITERLSKNNYVPGRIIFRTKDGTSKIVQQNILQSIDLSLEINQINSFKSFEITLDGSKPYFDLDYENNFFCVTVPQDKMLPTLISLNSDPNILTATVDTITPLGIIDPEMSVFEPHTGGSSAGYDIDSTIWAYNKIGLKDAWEKGFVGSDSITVALIDTGCHYCSELDNVLSFQSYNACDGSTDVKDEAGHGTFVAGIIGASLNQSGINGICQKVKIVPIKVSQTNSNGEVYETITAIKNALVYAQNTLNAPIANFSLGITADDYYVIKGIYKGLLVAAAGNANLSVELDSTCKGVIYAESNWIVVGASDLSDFRAVWGSNYGSNYHSKYVDLFAPGKSITSLSTNNKIATMSGTSAAVPFVTASAAIIMSFAKQYRNDPAALIDLLKQTVDYCYYLDGYCSSNGRLSLINAINYLYSENRGAKYGLYSLGDPTNDGYITSEDALLVKKYVLNAATLNDKQLLAADVDKNGVVNSMDYVLISRHVEQTYYIVP